MDEFKIKIQTKMRGRTVGIEITFLAQDESEAKEFLDQALKNHIHIDFDDLSQFDVNGEDIMEQIQPRKRRP